MMELFNLLYTPYEGTYMGRMELEGILYIYKIFDRYLILPFNIYLEKE